MSKIAPTLAFALALSVAALPVMAARAVDFSANRLQTLIKSLNLDSFQGRPSFGRGQDASTDALVYNMRALGLTPAGDPINGTDNDGDQKRAWTQAVPMVRFTLVDDPRAAVRLAGRDLALAQGSQVLLRTLRPVGSVNLGAAPLVFVGYGIEDPSRGWNDFAGADLTGKVAVALAGDPDTATFAGPAQTWPGRWTAKIEAAARHGAAGVLIIHDPAAAGVGWASLQKAFSGPQYDLLRTDPAAEHPQVEGWLSGAAASALFGGAGLNLASLKAQAAQPGFRALPMAGASFSAQYSLSFGQVLSYNVVGRIKGQARRDQAVVVTSHWDGPGAVDSVGAAAVLELARAHGGQTPNARSMGVFVLTGGSQEGGLGAAYYAANPTYPLSKTAAVVGLGPFDAAGPARDMTVFGDTSLDLSRRVTSVLTASGRTLTQGDQTAGQAYRTDAFPLARRGAPTITLGSGINLSQGGATAGQAWRSDYMRQRYRQAGDVLGRDVNLEGVAEDLNALYVFTRDLANQSDWPATAGEFSAARALSAGERR